VRAQGQDRLAGLTLGADVSFPCRKYRLALVVRAREEGLLGSGAILRLKCLPLARGLSRRGSGIKVGLGVRPAPQNGASPSPEGSDDEVHQFTFP
jgi:hypothetical protein